MSKHFVLGCLRVMVFRPTGEVVPALAAREELGSVLQAFHDAARKRPSEMDDHRWKRHCAHAEDVMALLGVMLGNTIAAEALARPEPAEVSDAG